MDTNSVYDYNLENEQQSNSGKAFYTEKIKPCNKPPCSSILKIKQWFSKLLS